MLSGGWGGDGGWGGVGGGHIICQKSTMYCCHEKFTLEIVRKKAFTSHRFTLYYLTLVVGLRAART